MTNWKDLTEGRSWDDHEYFCTLCFAAENTSSWSEPAANNHCFNCGSGGGTVLLPLWAIKSIRQNASWVGKRYYAHEEDFERSGKYPSPRYTTFADPAKPETFDSALSFIQRGPGWDDGSKVMIRAYSVKDIDEARKEFGEAIK